MIRIHAYAEAHAQDAFFARGERGEDARCCFTADLVSIWRDERTISLIASIMCIEVRVLWG
jgi:hypothetical protein